MDLESKILCVVKTSSYEYNIQEGIFEKFDKHRKGQLKYHHERQKKFEELFKEEVKNLGLDVTYIKDSEVEITPKQRYHYVFTLGGDGTLLNAMQHFEKCIFLGINSDKHESPVKGSIGALTSISQDTLDPLLQRLVQQDYTVEKWKRLYAKINGEQLPPLAVNDIYFGHKNAYATTNFVLEWNKQFEEFKGSSGIVFSTGMGSTAWYKNIGGAPFDNKLPIYAFAVRDVNYDRQPKFTKGTVDIEEEIHIRPLRGGYVLSFDSKSPSYILDETDILQIGLSRKKHVKVIRFP